MVWCRFQVGPHISHGIVEGDRVIEVSGSRFAEHMVTRTSHCLGQVKLLPPVIPAVLYAAGPNYRGHLEGMAKRRGEPPKYPARPEPNLRSVHAIIGTEEHIVVRHNGTVWEDFSSADQIWDTATWLHEMSKTATLHPGDVLWMGTEGADGDMVPGDVIEVEISGIGTLRNYVVAEA